MIHIQAHTHTHAQTYIETLDEDDEAFSHLEGVGVQADFKEEDFDRLDDQEDCRKVLSQPLLSKQTLTTGLLFRSLKLFSYIDYMLSRAVNEGLCSTISLTDIQHMVQLCPFESWFITLECGLRYERDTNRLTRVACQVFSHLAQRNMPLPTSVYLRMVDIIHGQRFPGLTADEDVVNYATLTLSYWLIHTSHALPKDLDLDAVQWPPSAHPQEDKQAEHHEHQSRAIEYKLAWILQKGVDQLMQCHHAPAQQSEQLSPHTSTLMAAFSAKLAISYCKTLRQDELQLLRQVLSYPMHQNQPVPQPLHSNHTDFPHYCRSNMDSKLAVPRGVSDSSKYWSLYKRVTGVGGRPCDPTMSYDQLDWSINHWRNAKPYLQERIIKVMAVAIANMEHKAFPLPDKKFESKSLLDRVVSLIKEALESHNRHIQCYGMIMARSLLTYGLWPERDREKQIKSYATVYEQALDVLSRLKDKDPSFQDASEEWDTLLKEWLEAQGEFLPKSTQEHIEYTRLNLNCHNISVVITSMRRPQHRWLASNLLLRQSPDTVLSEDDLKKLVHVFQDSNPYSSEDRQTIRYDHQKIQYNMLLFFYRRLRANQPMPSDWVICMLSTLAHPKHRQYSVMTLYMVKVVLKRPGQTLCRGDLPDGCVMQVISCLELIYKAVIQYTCTLHSSHLTHLHILKHFLGLLAAIHPYRVCDDMAKVKDGFMQRVVQQLLIVAQPLAQNHVTATLEPIIRCVADTVRTGYWLDEQSLYRIINLWNHVTDLQVKSILIHAFRAGLSQHEKGTLHYHQTCLKQLVDQAMRYIQKRQQDHEADVAMAIMRYGSRIEPLLHENNEDRSHMRETLAKLLTAQTSFRPWGRILMVIATHRLDIHPRHFNKVLHWLEDDHDRIPMLKMLQACVAYHGLSTAWFDRCFILLEQDHREQVQADIMTLFEQACDHHWPGYEQSAQRDVNYLRLLRVTLNHKRHAHQGLCLLSELIDRHRLALPESSLEALSKLLGHSSLDDPSLMLHILQNHIIHHWMRADQHTSEPCFKRRLHIIQMSIKAAIDTAPHGQVPPQVFPTLGLLSQILSLRTLPLDDDFIDAVVNLIYSTHASPRETCLIWPLLEHHHSNTGYLSDRAHHAFIQSRLIDDILQPHALMHDKIKVRLHKVDVDVERFPILDDLYQGFSQALKNTTQTFNFNPTVCDHLSMVLRWAHQDLLKMDYSDVSPSLKQMILNICQCMGAHSQKEDLPEAFSALQNQMGCFLKHTITKHVWSPQDFQTIQDSFLKHHIDAHSEQAQKVLNAAIEAHYPVNIPEAWLIKLFETALIPPISDQIKHTEGAIHVLLGYYQQHHGMIDTHTNIYRSKIRQLLASISSNNCQQPEQYARIKLLLLIGDNDPYALTNEYLFACGNNLNHVRHFSDQEPLLNLLKNIVAKIDDENKLDDDTALSALKQQLDAKAKEAAFLQAARCEPPSSQALQCFLAESSLPWLSEDSWEIIAEQLSSMTHDDITLLLESMVACREVLILPHTWIDQLITYLSQKEWRAEAVTILFKLNPQYVTCSARHIESMYQAMLLHPYQDKGSLQEAEQWCSAYYELIRHMIGENPLDLPPHVNLDIEKPLYQRHEDIFSERQHKLFSLSMMRAISGEAYKDRSDEAISQMIAQALNYHQLSLNNALSLIECLNKEHVNRRQIIRVFADKRLYSTFSLAVKHRLLKTLVTYWEDCLQAYDEVEVVIQRLCLESQMDSDLKQKLYTMLQQTLGHTTMTVNTVRLVASLEDQLDTTYAEMSWDFWMLSLSRSRDDDVHLAILIVIFDKFLTRRTPSFDKIKQTLSDWAINLRPKQNIGWTGRFKQVLAIFNPRSIQWSFSLDVQSYVEQLLSVYSTRYQINICALAARSEVKQDSKDTVDFKTLWTEQLLQNCFPEGGLASEGEIEAVKGYLSKLQSKYGELLGYDEHERRRPEDILFHLVLTHKLERYTPDQLRTILCEWQAMDTTPRFGLQRSLWAHISHTFVQRIIGQTFRDAQDQIACVIDFIEQHSDWTWDQKSTFLELITPNNSQTFIKLFNKINNIRTLNRVLTRILQKDPEQRIAYLHKTVFRAQFNALKKVLGLLPPDDPTNIRLKQIDQHVKVLISKGWPAADFTLWSQGQQTVDPQQIVYYVHDFLDLIFQYPPYILERKHVEDIQAITKDFRPQKEAAEKAQDEIWKLIREELVGQSDQEKDLATLKQEICDSTFQFDGRFPHQLTDDEKRCLAALKEDVDGITDFLKAFTDNCPTEEAEELLKKVLGRDEASNLSDETPWIDHLKEILKQISKTQGHRIQVRNTQWIAVLLMLKYRYAHRGLILEQKTGEGKSLVIALLALISSLFEKKAQTHTMTSNELLALEGVNDFHPLFKAMHIEMDHNTNPQVDLCEPPLSDKKNATRVVYGTPSTFQGNYLRALQIKHEQLDKQKGSASQPQSLAWVVVDEVDRLIDTLPQSTMLSRNMAGTSHLILLLSSIWKTLVALDQGNGGRPVSVEELKRQYKQQYVWDWGQKSDDHSKKTVLPVPKHLQSYVESSMQDWYQNAVHVFYDYRENVQYITDTHDQKGGVIPVDLGTGTHQSNTHLGGGIQQFLQIKHGMAASPIGIVPYYAFTLNYLSRQGVSDDSKLIHDFAGQEHQLLPYGSERFLGLTGTMGSQKERELWRASGVTCIRIPTYKKKRLLSMPPTVLLTREAWMVVITHRVLVQIKHKRVVLVLAADIETAQDIYQHLLPFIPQGTSCRCYADSLHDEASFLERPFEPSSILVSTNLSGRGTDIKLTDEVVEAGGMHVVLTFLPRHQRTEEQAFGRAGRKGQPGSGQIMTYFHDLKRRFKSMYLISDKEIKYILNHPHKIIEARDREESIGLNHLQQTISYNNKKDYLFIRYEQLLKSLDDLDDDLFKKFMSMGAFDLNQGQKQEHDDRLPAVFQQRNFNVRNSWMPCMTLKKISEKVSEKVSEKISKEIGEKIREEVSEKVSWLGQSLWRQLHSAMRQAVSERWALWIQPCDLKQTTEALDQVFEEKFRQPIEAGYQQLTVIDNPMIYIDLGNKWLEQTDQWTFSPRAHNSLTTYAQWAYQRAICLDPMFSYAAQYHLAMMMAQSKRYHAYLSEQRAMVLPQWESYSGSLSEQRKDISAVLEQLQDHLKNLLNAYKAVIGEASEDAHTQQLHNACSVYQLLLVSTLSLLSDLHQFNRYLKVTVTRPNGYMITYGQLTQKSAREQLEGMQAGDQHYGVTFTSLKTYTDLVKKSQLTQTIKGVQAILKKDNVQIELFFPGKNFSDHLEEQQKKLLAILDSSSRDPDCVDAEDKSSDAIVLQAIDTDLTSNHLYSKREKAARCVANGAQLISSGVQYVSQPFKNGAVTVGSAVKRGASELGQILTKASHPLEKAKQLKVTLHLEYLTYDPLFLFCLGQIQLCHDAWFDHSAYSLQLMVDNSEPSAENLYQAIEQSSDDYSMYTVDERPHHERATIPVRDPFHAPAESVQCDITYLSWDHMLNSLKTYHNHQHAVITWTLKIQHVSQEHAKLWIKNSQDVNITLQYETSTHEELKALVKVIYNFHLGACLHVTHLTHEQVKKVIDQASLKNYGLYVQKGYIINHPALPFESLGDHLSDGAQFLFSLSEKSPYGWSMMLTMVTGLLEVVAGGALLMLTSVGCLGFNFGVDLLTFAAADIYRAARIAQTGRGIELSQYAQKKAISLLKAAALTTGLSGYRHLKRLVELQKAFPGATMHANFFNGSITVTTRHSAKVAANLVVTADLASQQLSTHHQLAHRAGHHVGRHVASTVHNPVQTVQMAQQHKLSWRRVLEDAGIHLSEKISGEVASTLIKKAYLSLEAEYRKATARDRQDTMVQFFDKPSVKQACRHLFKADRWFDREGILQTRLLTELSHHAQTRGRLEATFQAFTPYYLHEFEKLLSPYTSLPTCFAQLLHHKLKQRYKREDLQTWCDLLVEHHLITDDNLHLDGAINDIPWPHPLPWSQEDQKLILEACQAYRHCASDHASTWHGAYISYQKCLIKRLEIALVQDYKKALYRYIPQLLSLATEQGIEFGFDTLIEDIEHADDDTEQLEELNEDVTNQIEELSQHSVYAAHKSTTTQTHQCVDVQHIEHHRDDVIPHEADSLLPDHIVHPYHDETHAGPLDCDHSLQQEMHHPSTVDPLLPASSGVGPIFDSMVEIVRTGAEKIFHEMKQAEQQVIHIVMDGIIPESKVFCQEHVECIVGIGIQKVCEYGLGSEASSSDEEPGMDEDDCELKR